VGGVELVGEDVGVGVITQRRLLTAWEMASSLLAGRRSEELCSMEMTWSSLSG